MAPPEAGQQPGHRHPGDALLGAQGQGPAQHPLHRGDRLVRRPHLGEDPPCLLQQRPPRLRQRHPAGRAHEQRCPQLPLQRPDRRRQPGLGHQQAFRRPGEVLVLGDRHEVLEMTQFHD